MRHPGESLRAVVFDLDGTLADTAGDFIPVVQTLRAEHALAPLPNARIRNTVSNGGRALVTLALNLREGDPGFEAALERLLFLYGNTLGREARLFPGLALCLRQLAEAGIRWGIATNKPQRFTAPLVEALAIDPAPGSIVCADQVPQGKPDPACLLRAAEELECEPAQVIYVGDHARDIEAGQRAGMYTLAAAWGYIEDGDDPMRWGADGLLEEPAALLAALLPPAPAAEA
jgi:phosphoglycolate phosphatase